MNALDYHNSPREKIQGVAQPARPCGARRDTTGAHPAAEVHLGHDRPRVPPSGDRTPPRGPRVQW